MSHSKARLRLSPELADYNIETTTTGRFDASKPNVSNVPKLMTVTKVSSTLFVKSGFQLMTYQTPIRGILEADSLKKSFVRPRRPGESRRGLPMDSFGDPDQLAPYFERPCNYCNDHTLMQWLTDNRYQAMMAEFHRRTRGLYRIHAHLGMSKVDFPRRNENGFFVVHTVTSRNGIYYAVTLALRSLQFPVLPCLSDS